MQNCNNKKKSLFSQRIKEVREKQNQKAQISFPKALKIDLKIEDMEQNQIQHIKGTKFIDKLLHGNLKKAQVEQIQRDNLNSIRNMSVEQIKQYQQLIINQMHPNFLNKLKQVTKKLSLNDQNNNQMYQQHKQIDQNIQNFNNQIQLTKQTNLDTLERVAFNVDKKKCQIYYEELNQSNESVVPSSTIQRMIKSDNNQTQIMGSKLMSQICQQIFTKNSFQAISLTKIQNQVFHLTVLALQIHEKMFVPLMVQIKKTRFKSCFIQMMVSILNSLENMGRYLIKINNGQLYNGVVKFIKHQTTKRKQFYLTNQSAPGQLKKLFNFKEINAEIQQHQSQQKENISFQLLQTVRKLPTDVIQQLLLQSQFNAKNSSFKFLGFLQQVEEYFEHDQCHLLSFVYSLSLQLLSFDYSNNNMNSDFSILKKDIYEWYIKQCPNKQLLPPLSSIKIVKTKKEESEIFKKLFLLKILSYQAYMKLLEGETGNEMADCSQIREITVDNNTVANMLTYLNIEEYFSKNTIIKSSEQKVKDIENIQNMLTYIAKQLANNDNNSYIKQISPIILLDLMIIFTNSLQQFQKQNIIQFNYFDLNLLIVNNVLGQICNIIVDENMEQKLWRMITQEKIKRLIQAYNYNSFGHYGFTRLLFFLLGSCPRENTIVVIIEQVLTRYPFLFYYAIEQGYYGAASLYTKGVVLPQMGNIYSILQLGNKIQPQNMLIRYLLKR